MKRYGDWMQTATGGQFWPLDPKEDEIVIEDIAAALSKMCRFGGHCLRFYSVAEHCVHIANAAPPHLKLAALLHDASEAYLSDIVRPVKQFLGNYLEIESKIEQTIASKYGLQWPWNKEIKRLDNAILADERIQNMAKPPAPWNEIEPPLGITLGFWDPATANTNFIIAFCNYYYANK